MTTRRAEDMIDDYLGQLRAALRATPAPRRDQIVSDVAQHIAEALAEEPNSDEATVSSLLDRIGTPAEIAAALDETSDADLSRRPQGPSLVDRRPPVPVRAAVKLMYLGAAMSLVTALVDLLTRSGLKTAIEKGTDNASRLHGLPKLTPSQVNSSVTDNLVMAVIFSLVSVVLWVFMARATADGQSSARITGSGLVRTRWRDLADRAGRFERAWTSVSSDGDLLVRGLVDRARCSRTVVAEGFQRVLQGLAQNVNAPRPRRPNACVAFLYRRNGESSFRTRLRWTKPLFR